MARQTIEDAESDRPPRPSQTVAELTIGNTGAALTIVCRLKAYRPMAVMSRDSSPERARMMAASGAKMALIDQLPGSKPGEDRDLLGTGARRKTSHKPRSHAYSA